MYLGEKTSARLFVRHSNVCSCFALWSFFSGPLIPTLPPYPSQVDKFVKYLRRVVPVLLEEEDDVPETFNKALQDRQYLENIKKFISDPQVRGKATATKHF